MKKLIIATAILFTLLHAGPAMSKENLTETQVSVMSDYICYQMVATASQAMRIFIDGDFEKAAALNTVVNKFEAGTVSEIFSGGFGTSEELNSDDYREKRMASVYADCIKIVKERASEAKI